MTLIFVFATISSPMHALSRVPAPLPPAALSHGMATMDMAPMDMTGMSDACARAMKAAALKAHPGKPQPAGHSDGCCSVGCSCPLSHCPATAGMLVAEVPAVFLSEPAAVAASIDDGLPFHLTDTLKRPPRA